MSSGRIEFLPIAPASTAQLRRNQAFELLQSDPVQAAQWRSRRATPARATARELEPLHIRANPYLAVRRARHRLFALPQPVTPPESDRRAMEKHHHLLAIGMLRNAGDSHNESVRGAAGLGNRDSRRSAALQRLADTQKVVGPEELVRRISTRPVPHDPAVKDHLRRMRQVRQV